MQRRDFLKLAGMAPLTLMIPGLGRGIWALAEPEGQMPLGRILVLVELKGGNDGLNTLVPFRDDPYYKLRPRLAIPKKRVISLSDQVGLNEVLKPVMPAWEAKELAIVQGVGYPNPNRSHFRSIEIWETGSKSDEYLQEGWIAQLFKIHRPKVNLVADGIIVGREDQGPLMGKAMRNIVIQDPHRFLAQAKGLKATSIKTENKSLAHLLRVQNDIRKAADMIQEKLKSTPALPVSFPRTRLGRQLELAAKILASHIPVAIIKVTLSGFDTHGQQKNVHDRLLKELAEALSLFRQSMIKAGLWKQLLVMTYSEFGRRVSENGSAGTDHGTSAPHFLMGGEVKGGFYGEQPSLKDLNRGDLKYKVDFRRMYATIAQKWWQIPKNLLGDTTHPPIACI